MWGVGGGGKTVAKGRGGGGGRKGKRIKRPKGQVIFSQADLKVCHKKKAINGGDGGRRCK